MIDTNPNPAARIGNLLLILPINTLLYLWFCLSYPLVWLWFHLAALLFARDRERAFQWVNHWHYRSFVGFARVMLPGFRLRIDPAVRQISGAVVVLNHLSFFDTVLVMSLFPRQKTIVKGVMFKIPFMGWAQNLAGYIPSHTGSPFHQVLNERLAGLRAFFDGGGVLFVFPEGTRSRDGRLGHFKKGAFNIAARAGCPVDMVRIEGSNRLQPVGAMMARPFPGSPVVLTHIGSLKATAPDSHSALEMARQAAQVFRAGEEKEPQAAADDARTA